MPKELHGRTIWFVQWRLAAAAAGKLGARPLGAALDDLARRARLDARDRTARRDGIA